MSEPDSVDAALEELRRFVRELPDVTSVLTQQASGEGGNGAARVTCALSGEVTNVEIGTRFLRENPPARVDAAILEALQAAQSAASRLLVAEQRGLRFMGCPSGRC